MFRRFFAAFAAAALLLLAACGGGGGSSGDAGTGAGAPMQVGTSQAVCENPAAPLGAYSTKFSTCVRRIGVEFKLSDATVPTSAGVVVGGQDLPAGLLPLIDDDTVGVVETGTVASATATDVIWWLGYNDPSHAGQLILYNRTTGTVVAVVKLSGELTRMTGTPKGVTVQIAIPSGSKTMVYGYASGQIVCTSGC